MNTYHEIQHSNEQYEDSLTTTRRTTGAVVDAHALAMILSIRGHGAAALGLTRGHAIDVTSAETITRDEAVSRIASGILRYGNRAIDAFSQFEAAIRQMDDALRD